jgi:exosome complex component RRP40
MLINRHIAYELAIGMNGQIWIQSNSVEECVIVRNAVLNSMELDTFQAEAMVEILIEKMKIRKNN